MTDLVHVTDGTPTTTSLLVADGVQMDHASNGEMGCSYTTYVQPSGIDFIRRKLGLPAIDPIPGIDADAAVSRLAEQASA